MFCGTYLLPRWKLGILGKSISDFVNPLLLFPAEFTFLIVGIHLASFRIMVDEARISFCRLSPFTSARYSTHFYGSIFEG